MPGQKCSVCSNSHRQEIDRLVADPVNSLRRIAAQFHLSATSLRRHRTLHLVPALAHAVAEKHAKRVEDLAEFEIGRREARVASMNDRWRKLHQIAQERGAGMEDVPGGKTGLLVRHVKGIGSGDNFQEIEEYKVDTGLLREMRAHEQAAAEELGQREIGGSHVTSAGPTVLIFVPSAQMAPGQVPTGSRIIDIVPGPWRGIEAPKNEEQL